MTSKIFHSIISVLILVIALAQPSYAQQEADHEELRKLVSAYEEAVKKKQPELLKPHLANEFTGVMVTNERVNDFESLDQYWKKIQDMMGEGGTYTVEVEPSKLSTIVGSIAYAHGTTKDHVVTSDGTIYNFTSQWSAVCRKEDGVWKIASIHGSMDPLENSFVLKAIKTASIFVGVIAGVGGFLLGVIVILLLKRKRTVTNPT